MTSLLSGFFQGVGVKRLRDVEINKQVSNQHEFNGIDEFKILFGSEKSQHYCHFIYLKDKEEEIIQSQGQLTWYDARQRNEKRTEYRLYYSTNEVMSAASTDDLLVIGRTVNETLAVIIAPKGSTSESQLLWLFGFSEVGHRFELRDFRENDEELGFAGKYIINSLGFELPETEPDYLSDLLNLYGADFPPTTVFSGYTRNTLSESIAPVENPDSTLLKLMEREEKLFRTLEKQIVQERLKQGFGEDGSDVDAFIKFSLSVQNRRKSRAGYAFENHLAYIFDQNSLHYSRGAKTERNNTPDFLFPGISFYKDERFSVNLLSMLGVKTTAKDRWRQVLSEADRINKKHLITLEPAISKNQTDEMIAQNLQLVVPSEIFDTYTHVQRKQLINLSEFIDIVKNKQNLFDV